METETQRVLLALEKEALKWDAHDDIKLHLHRGIMGSVQFFFKTWKPSSHPTPQFLKPLKQTRHHKLRFSTIKSDKVVTALGAL